MSLKFKLSKNNEVLNEFNVEVQSLEDYNEYRKALKTLQADVNALLTTLVIQEQDSAFVEAEKDEETSDSDSDDKKSPKPKRALSNDQVVPATPTKVKRN